MILPVSVIITCRIHLVFCSYEYLGGTGPESQSDSANEVRLFGGQLREGEHRQAERVA